MPFLLEQKDNKVCMWRTSVHWVWEPSCPEYGRQGDACSAAIVESQGQVLKVWTLPQRCRGIHCSKQQDTCVPENGQQAGTPFCVFITDRELGLPTPSAPRMPEEDWLLSLLGFPITRRSSLEAILVSQAVRKFILIKYTGLWGGDAFITGACFKEYRYVHIYILGRDTRLRLQQACAPSLPSPLSSYASLSGDSHRTNPLGLNILSKVWNETLCRLQCLPSWVLLSAWYSLRLQGPSN